MRHYSLYREHRNLRASVSASSYAPLSRRQTHSAVHPLRSPRTRRNTVAAHWCVSSDPYRSGNRHSFSLPNACSGRLPYPVQTLALPLTPVRGVSLCRWDRFYVSLKRIFLFKQPSRKSLRFCVGFFLLRVHHRQRTAPGWQYLYADGARIHQHWWTACRSIVEHHR